VLVLQNSNMFRITNHEPHKQLATESNNPEEDKGAGE